MTTNWIVITGVPSSGKSTLVSALALRGYEVSGDTTREFIEVELGRGMSIGQIRGQRVHFRRKTFQLMLDAHRSGSPSARIFYDGGLPDCVAYRNLEGVAIEDEVLEACSSFRYREVFYLEPLPFRDDGVRVESESEIKRLQSLLVGAYSQFGYKPRAVPACDIKSRVSLILRSLATV